MHQPRHCHFQASGAFAASPAAKKFVTTYARQTVFGDPVSRAFSSPAPDTNEGRSGAKACRPQKMGIRHQ